MSGPKVLTMNRMGPSIRWIILIGEFGAIILKHWVSGGMISVGMISSG